MNLSALARDHVNNFRDTSTSICQTEKSGRHLHWAQDIRIYYASRKNDWPL